MPRKRARKTTMGLIDPEVMKQAAEDVAYKGKSMRATASTYNIPKSTLLRYVRKCKISREEGSSTCMLNIKDFEPNYAVRRIFTDCEEEELEEYLIEASRHHYGLARKDVLELAWQFAVRNGKRVPASWVKEGNTRAGPDWLRGFLTRRTKLTLRQPESTSLSRATSFNRKNVDDFFENLETVMKRHTFPAERIFNVDETGLTTVQKPCRVIAEKGRKQVGQVTSAERGTLVTMIGCINAIGNSVPPAFIFPRVNFKSHMMIGAPTGSVGFAYKTGWVNSTIFLGWLKHFLTHSNCSKSNPVLLLMDNHNSHISIESVEFSKQNGIVLLTLPPHCSQKLQPLDKTVYGPLKAYYNTGVDSWLGAHPGQTISIYDIPGIASLAYGKAFTPANIVSGFLSCGIFPLNKNVFKDEDFLCSYVTDRPETFQQDFSGSDDVAQADKGFELSPASPSDADLPTTSAQGGYLSPKDLRPFKKAGPRKKKRSNRGAKTRILTDTPEKDAIIAKLSKTGPHQCASNRRLSIEYLPTPLIENSSSDDEEEAVNPSVGDYVLVKFKANRLGDEVYYVGKVIDIDDDNDLDVTFMQKILSKVTRPAFVFPDDEDLASVAVGDVVCILPIPSQVGGTARASKHYRFGIDMSKWNVQ
ncbi:uncharacterized protein LOC144419992 [Styela clava]